MKIETIAEHPGEHPHLPLPPLPWRALLAKVGYRWPFLCLSYLLLGYYTISISILSDLQPATCNLTYTNNPLLYSTVAGFSWVFGRIVYAMGYYTGKPANRLYGFAVKYISICNKSVDCFVMTSAHFIAADYKVAGRVASSRDGRRPCRKYALLVVINILFCPQVLNIKSIFFQ